MPKTTINKSIPSKVSADKQKTEELLTRGVENIYPSREFLIKKLKAGKKLRLYFGIDPTGPTLHLGHAIALMKLKKWQESGHKVVLLIGSFTGMVGDPTDKMATRKPLTRKKVLDNCQKYKNQAEQFVKFSGSNPGEIVFNHQWLDKLSFREEMEIFSCLTVQQLLQRDMFEKRMKQGKPISLQEFLYPVMQGYDSVAIDKKTGLDGEIGGNDQTFNMLVGRDLMKAMRRKEKFVVAMKLLTDPAGDKMGKTTGNMITLDDSAEDVYGKAMSYPDSIITAGMELLTDLPMNIINNVAESLKKGENPMRYKKVMAFEIVKALRGVSEAQKAQKYFEKTVQKKEIPDEIASLQLPAGRINIVDLLLKTKLASSKGEARRLIKQDGIKIDNKVVKDTEKKVKITREGILVQRGKRRFVRVKRKT